MRWKQAQERDARIRSGFLFFPKCIDGEWRWLERARWKQIFVASYTDCGWVNLSWIDDGFDAATGVIYVSDKVPPPEHHARIWLDTSVGEYKLWTGTEWEIVKRA